MANLQKFKLVVKIIFVLLFPFIFGFIGASFYHWAAHGYLGFTFWDWFERWTLAGTLLFPFAFMVAWGYYGEFKKEGVKC